MKDNQTCSLEQAEKLHKLGVMQSTQYHHFCLGFFSDGKGNYPARYEVRYHKDAPEGYVGSHSHSAYSIGELIHAIGTVSIQKDGIRWYVRAEISPTAENLAWCLTELILHRIENGIITVEQLNRRLNGEKDLQNLPPGEAKG